MSRTFNLISALIGAVALALLLGACETKTENATVPVVENAVDENTATVNMDVAVENAVDASANAADTSFENAGTATDANASESATATPPPPPPPPPVPGPLLLPGESSTNATTANAAAPANTINAANSAAPEDQAERGFGSFKKLDDMEVDNLYTVEFFIAPDKEGLAEEAEAKAKDMTAPTAIYVAPLMRVTLLKDPNFEIAAKTDAVQTTGRDRRASWQWDVKPLTDGVRTLFARVEVLKRKPDGSLEATETRTRHVGVKVKVGTWKGFLIALKNAATLGDALSTLFASWEKTLTALAALIGALVTVVVAWRKLRG